MPEESTLSPTRLSHQPTPPSVPMSRFALEVQVSGNGLIRYQLRFEESAQADRVSVELGSPAEHAEAARAVRWPSTHTKA